MQRYTVNFRETDLTTRRLLVPFQSSSTVDALAEEVKQRLGRAGIVVEADAFLLRLDDVNGPQLDGADTLGDVILDPRAEQIFAIVPRTSAPPARPGQEASSDTPTIDDFVSPAGSKSFESR